MGIRNDFPDFASLNPAATHPKWLLFAILQATPSPNTFDLPPLAINWGLWRFFFRNLSECYSMPTVDQRYDEAINLQQAGKLEEAVEALEALIVDEPGYALGHAALSVFYGKLSRHDEAVEHAQKVCELEPNDPFSFMALSLIAQRAGKISEAEQAMGAAMEKQWAARRPAGG